MLLIVFVFFFFKQKTAYELRISDWSSDVCSSDLAGDGARFLVDRLWPRGVSKDKAALTAWLKPLSPSDAMREEFHHATANSDAAWSAFRKEYFAALDAGGEIGRAHV